ncbi:DUF1109 domain-containing protein [Nocardia nova]|uniref:DUF1109 domain-containing protein n=1 Tax=Nocardia nova TaxID=37330 RepID=A0A2S6AGM0_9NOCA|nr:DUF1109 domain-containing protein [Nocardia nova]PPJ20146.1 DUF1109 domain-containing protein [Nocardia nova]PPJ33914.1 DUF1109 domain-containing protein [Nocardia nova]
MDESDAVGPPASSPGRGAKPPGSITTVVAVLAVAVLVCLHYGWWPSRFGSMRWADPLLAGAAALVLLGIAGLLWAIRTLYLLGRDRRWSWWVLPVPLTVLAAGLMVILAPRTTFDETRPEFERVARELLAGPDTVRSDVEVGRFDIAYARVGPAGEVYFVEAGGLGLDASSGWVYSPKGSPAGFDDFSATHLGGPWYGFTAVWRT